MLDRFARHQDCSDLDPAGSDFHKGLSVLQAGSAEPAEQGAFDGELQALKRRFKSGSSSRVMRSRTTFTVREIPYFDFPRILGWCVVSTSATFTPYQFATAGMNLCISPYRFRFFITSLR